MPKFNDQWTVGPHGPLEQIDDGLVSVAGEIVMPLGRFPRRMTAVTLSDNRLVIWSPIPLREPEMAQLERLGTIAFLIVPGIGHRLDIRAWKARYPQAAILCPPGARGKRKLGPLGPPSPRRGPSGPRRLKISSILAERRGGSPPPSLPPPVPPPGSQGLRGPRVGLGVPSEDGGEPGSDPLSRSPSALPPSSLGPPPHGPRLPAIASAILLHIPPNRSMPVFIGASARKNRAGARILHAGP